MGRCVVRALVLAVVSMLLGLEAATAAVAPGAAVVRDVPWTPPGYAQTDLGSVSCWAPAGCAAVEGFRDRTPQPAVAVLTGGEWTTTRVALPAGLHRGDLSDVSCVAADWCLAVGTGQGSGYLDLAPIAYVWNGESWTAAPVPLPDGASYLKLAGVSCWAASDCVAVGESDPAGGDGAVAERLAGETWTATSVPNPAGEAGRLADVSCTSAQFCVAVGRTDLNNALVARFDGQTWSAADAATQDGSQQSDLTSVSCPASQQCFAAGDYYVSYSQQGDMADTVTPTATTSQALATSGTGQPAISCADAAWCAVVDHSAHTAVLSNGAWTAGVVSNPSGAFDTELVGVGCAAIGPCVAGGFASYAGNADEAIAATLDSDTWSAARIPVDGVPEVWDASIGCGSPAHCVAVGEFVHGDYQRSDFMAARTGTTWSSRTIRPSSSTLSEPMRVSCPSATWCLAVGLGGTSTTQIVAAVYRDGHWHASPLPLPDLAYQVDGMSRPSCPAAGDCKVLISYPGREAHLMVASLQKGGWQVQALPRPPGGTGQFFDLGVSCPTTTWCGAMGATSSSGFSGSAIAGFTYASGTWRARWLSRPAKQDSRSFVGFSCASPGRCVAVGKSADDVSEYWQASIAQWNGTRFTETDLPLSASAYNESLSDVACPAAEICVAVGTHTTADGSTEQPLVEHLVDDSWQPAVVGLSPAMADASLSSVACPAGSAACQAVGTAVEYDGGDHLVTRPLTS